MIDHLFSPSTINLCGWIWHVPLICHYTWHGFLLTFAAAGMAALQGGRALK